MSQYINSMTKHLKFSHISIFTNLYDSRNSRRSKLQKVRNQKAKEELTKSLSDHSLSSLIEKQEFSTSKVTERNKSTDIVLESLAKNVKTTKGSQINTGKETDSDKIPLTYADKVEKPTEQVVDLSQSYSDLLAGENRLYVLIMSRTRFRVNPHSIVV